MSDKGTSILMFSAIFTIVFIYKYANKSVDNCIFMIYVIKMFKYMLEIYNKELKLASFGKNTSSTQ